MTDPFIISAHDSIEDIGRDAWNACAGTGHPFTRFEFLHALEASGSVTRETGWLPQHLTLTDANGDVAAVMPLYLKSHSMGEYVFDHAWARAYAQAGGRYYPKLQASIPFTPAQGPRLLVADTHPDPAALRDALAKGAAEIAGKIGVSSLHVTFATPPDIEALVKAGFLLRTDQQYHWTNDNYPDFDAFLASLASRKRKAIKRERQLAVANDIEISILTGADIQEDHWDHFYAFYTDTGARKWGHPYLSRAFFSLVSETMADQIALVMCRREGRYIAGALNYIGQTALYGRHWGCLEDHRFLHFEACYYQAIEFAIARGLKRVEAGAQGQHKLARGYLPHTTTSAHWIADPGFRDAIRDYLTYEGEEVAREQQLLRHHSPFRKPE